MACPHPLVTGGEVLAPTAENCLVLAAHMSFNKSNEYGAEAKAFLFPDLASKVGGHEPEEAHEKGSEGGMSVPKLFFFLPFWVFQCNQRRTASL